MHTVKSCCCGYSLQTGTQILSIVHVASFSLAIVISLTVAATHAQLLAIPIVILFGAIIISIPAASFYGVTKKKPLFLMPFLGFLLVNLVSTLILMVVVAFTGLQIFNSIIDVEFEKNLSDNIIGAISLLIAEAFNYYFFVVVLSCYKELKGETQP